MNLLVQGIIPFILLLALNIKIYLQIQHLSRQRSIQDQSLKAKEVRHTQVNTKPIYPKEDKCQYNVG